MKSPSFLSMPVTRGPRVWLAVGRQRQRLDVPLCVIVMTICWAAIQVYGCRSRPGMRDLGAAHVAEASEKYRQILLRSRRERAKRRQGSRASRTIRSITSACSCLIARPRSGELDGAGRATSGRLDEAQIEEAPSPHRPVDARGVAVRAKRGSAFVIASSFSSALAVPGGCGAALFRQRDW